MVFSGTLLRVSELGKGGKLFLTSFLWCFLPLYGLRCGFLTSLLASWASGCFLTRSTSTLERDLVLQGSDRFALLVYIVYMQRLLAWSAFGLDGSVLGILGAALQRFYPSSSWTAGATYIWSTVWMSMC